MSDDIVSRVGGAILLAETEWTPKAGVSKERAMALAAIEALRAPSLGMVTACWPLHHPWGNNAPAPGERTLMFDDMEADVTAYWQAMIDAALKS